MNTGVHIHIFLHLMEVKLMQMIRRASTLSSKDEVTVFVYKNMTQWVTDLEEQ